MKSQPLPVQPAVILDIIPSLKECVLTCFWGCFLNCFQNTWRGIMCSPLHRQHLISIYSRVLLDLFPCTLSVWQNQSTVEVWFVHCIKLGQVLFLSELERLLLLSVLFLQTHNTWHTGLFIDVECLTSVTEVINEDDLFQQDGRCGLQHAVNSPQQGGPGLVVEGYDHGGGG